MMAQFVTVTFLTLCLAGFEWETNAQTSDCAINADCEKCPIGEYEIYDDCYYSYKVCCPQCGVYFKSSYDEEENMITCRCDQYLVNGMRGDCWRGHQCDPCLSGPNATASRIGTVPICCAECENSGLKIGVGGEIESCNCLHNGDNSNGKDNDVIGNVRDEIKKRLAQIKEILP